MKTFIKNNYIKIIKYFLIFIFLVFWSIFIQNITGDEIWNYGFAHNIYKGLIPYKDFNMVVTPLFPFLMSILFHIFGSNLLVIEIENAIIMTIIIFLVEKKLKKNTWMFALFMFFPLQIVFPSYNMFILMLCIIILFLEEKKGYDYLIGFILALAVLTKQSIGVCMILPSLIYYKQPKKLLKRFVGFLFPMIIFLIYLLISKSFMQFVDLCFLGLFDFSNKNGRLFKEIPGLIFIIILVIVLIIMIIKYPKKISNYYTLAYLSIVLPLFDVYHIQMACLLFLYNLLTVTNYQFKIKVALFCPVIIIFCTCVWGCCNYGKGHTFPNDINHFQYKLLDDESIKFTKEISYYIKEHEDKEIIFFTTSAYYIKIANDMKITWLDLVNDGNWGYNGEEKMMKEVKKRKNAIYFIDRSELHEKCQTNYNVMKYIMKNGKKIDKLRIYDVYIFE